MKDTLINTTLFIIAILVIAVATWYVSPNGSIDREEEFEILSKREIIDFVVEEDIFGSFVNYSYVGDKLPEKLAENEVVEARTESSFTKLTDILNEGTKEEELILDLVSYTQRTFIEKDGEWFYIEHGEVLKDIFDKATKRNLVSRVFGNIVYAADTIYAGVGDGYVRGTSGISWADVHDAVIGGEADATSVTALTLSYYSISGAKVPLIGWNIYRTYFPFDTSSIPSSSTISAATLNVYVTATSDNDNDGDDYITVIRTDQPTHTTLTTSDYNNAGATSTPTEGVATGQRKDITNISTSAYLTFTLNSTGIGWIAKSGVASNCSSTNGISCFGLREGHDTTNSVIATPEAGSVNQNSITTSLSEETGTTQDPYLSVTYALPSTFAPWMFHEF